MSLLMGGSGIGFAASTSQSDDEPVERKVQIFGHASYNPSTRSFTESATFTAFLEQGSSRRSYDGGDGIGFEFGGMFSLTKTVAVMASIEILQASHDAEVSVTAPNPLLFNRPNQASSTETGLDYSERAVHIDVAYTAQASPNFTIDLFAGPSLFLTDLTLVDELVTSSVYPFDELTLTSTSTVELSETGFGFNAGAIATYFFTPAIGASFSARFSQASIDFTRTDGSSVEIDAGGFRVGGGLRIKF